MKRNLFKYFSIFLIISGMNLTSFSRTEIKENINPESISKNYLKQIPNNEYIIDSGDGLIIDISSLYPELFSKVTVNGEGTIYLPKLGRIFVKGLTTVELNKLLTESYKEFLKFPEVTVEVNSYRPIRVIVEGEVENPGLHTLSGSLTKDPLNINNQERYNDEFEDVEVSSLLSAQRQQKISFYFPTLFDALRKSGGVTQLSDLSNIKIIRKNSLSKGGGKIMATIDFDDLLTYGDNASNIRIYDSDIIQVPRSNNPRDLNLKKAILSNLNPRFINVFIAGRVNSPGNLQLTKVNVLSDAVDMAGGIKAIRGPLTFIRINNDGSIDKRKFNYRKNSKRGSYKNPNLKNGDLIIVGENLLNVTSEILEDITRPFVGVFSTYAFIDAIYD